MAAGIRKQLKSVLDRVAGLTGAYERRFRLQMTIVAFHRVNDRLVGDPLTCSAAKFEAFCNFFLTHFSVLPLSEQVAGARAGKDLGGTLSITFDDGYFDNSEVAAPILRRLQLPATFLVTTGFIGSQITPPRGSESAGAAWLDELGRCARAAFRGFRDRLSHGQSSRHGKDGR